MRANPTRTHLLGGLFEHSTGHAVCDRCGLTVPVVFVDTLNGRLLTSVNEWRGVLLVDRATDARPLCDLATPFERKLRAVL